VTKGETEGVDGGRWFKGEVDSEDVPGGTEEPSKVEVIVLNLLLRQPVDALN